MRRAGWRPVGSGTDGTWGDGARQPEGSTRTGQGWRGLAPPGPSRCAARPVHAAPLWSWADEAWPNPGGGGQGTSRPSEASVPQPTAAFLWSLSPGAWGGRKGGPHGGQRNLLPRPTLPTKPLSDRRPWGWRQPGTRLLPRQGHTNSSRCGEALGSGRSPAPPPPTGWRTGQCRTVPLAQEGLRWENSSSAPVLRPPPGRGDAGPPSEHSPEPEGAQPGVATSPGKGWEGRRGCRSPHPPPPTGRHWEGRPPRVRAEGGWTVAGLVAAGAKASGAPLPGAGPGWGHRKSQ